MDSVSLIPTLTLTVISLWSNEEGALALDLQFARHLRDAFVRGSGHGLLQLGAGEAGAAVPPAFSYWREFGARYVTALCTLPESGASPEKASINSKNKFSFQDVTLVVTGRAIAYIRNP